MSNSVNNFLLSMKEKCEEKAKQMANLELSIWDEKHEQELIENFNFTPKQLRKRKKELQQKTLK